MQKARSQAYSLRSVALLPLVSVWFQVHYPPLVGVLLIFRSRYWFAIGRQGVLSLAGWSPPIQAGFHVPDPTRVPDRGVCVVAYGTITRSGAAFQRASADARSSHDIGPTTPGGIPPGLG